MDRKTISEIAPTGKLRAGINLANIFLVTDFLANGEPDGVSPNIVKEIGKKLGVDIQYLSCDTPGETAETIKSGKADIVLIADEKKRAEYISFTKPYVEIEATYLVSKKSGLRRIVDVDKSGVRIAVSATSAYDLYLTRTIKYATLCRAEGLDAAAKLFAEEKLEALAGLRPALNDNNKDLPDSFLLDGNYMTVKQSIGTSHENTVAHKFLEEFVFEAKKSGLISGLLHKHHVTDQLKIAT